MSTAPDAMRAADLEGVLIRNGFVRCDIAACNCGSWHARYGLPERMQELRDALAEAGHALSNENGNLISRALAALIAERDAQAARIAELEAEREEISLLNLLVDLRFALGDNGKRMQPELVEYAKQIAADAARYRALVASGKYCPTSKGGVWGLALTGRDATKAELDAAVDAARSAGGAT